MKKKYRILIVDDVEEELLTLSMRLEQEEYRVDRIKSTAEALNNVKSEKYHIVLTKIVMENMDGLELLKQIKKYDPMVQIIMMADDLSIDRILSALEYGANDYIYNPTDNLEYVVSLVDYSVQKLERWRNAIVQIIQ